MRQHYTANSRILDQKRTVRYSIVAMTRFRFNVFSAVFVLLAFAGAGTAHAGVTGCNGKKVTKTPRGTIICGDISSSELFTKQQGVAKPTWKLPGKTTLKKYTVKYYVKGKVHYRYVYRRVKTK